MAQEFHIIISLKFKYKQAETKKDYKFLLLAFRNNY